MQDKNKTGKNGNELFISSHMMMVMTYTIFSAILIGEIFAMNWEKWAAFLIAGGVVAAWYIHFSAIGNDQIRLWIVSLLMMATFFYYGTHDTSTYDLAVVICVVMFLYTMTGIHSLVTLCQISYYITLTYELFNLAAGGTVFDVLLISRTLLHIAIVTMTAWIARTIINKWNEVLDQSKEEITILNESAVRLSDFIANVSHEIRTPINAILGMCGIALSEETDKKKRDELKSIETAGKKIGEQIEDILDFSEIDRGSLSNNCEDYMLSSVFNDIVNRIEPYRKKNIELIIDVDAGIPSVLNTDVEKLKKILWHTITNGLKYTKDGGVYVHVSQVPHDYGINLCFEIRDTGIGMDEQQLEKIYDDFYKADSGRTRNTGGLGLGMMIVHGFVRSLGGFMTVESEVDEGTVVRISIPNKVVDQSECMSVRDKDGISLGAYIHFEKYSNPHVREFYDSMVRNIVTGLKVSMHRVDNIDSLHALTDSKRLTHLFAGPEEYNSDVPFMEELAKNIIVAVVANPEDLNLPPDSRVRVMPKPFYCFPVVGILNSNIDDKVEEEGRIVFPGVRALVVDDEPMNLIVSEGVLKQYEMDVTTCESGQMAVELCRKNEYDIIFMDHMMPQMDGIEAMRRIRSDQAAGRVRVPIIAFTANAVSSAREMFKREGFDGFLGKPVDTVELERILRRVLPSAVVKNSTGPVKTGHNEDTGHFENRKTDVFDALRDAGVDVSKGLYYSQNDIEFYHTLIRQYAKESDKKKEIMKQAISSGDLASYAIQVHSVKSTSKMIGALKLSEKAAGLEAKAKENDAAYVNENHESMMSEYDRIISVIKNDATGSEMPVSDDAEQEEILEFRPAEDMTEGGQ